MLRRIENDCGFAFHPLSFAFPLLVGKDFDDFVADVRAKGTTDKIYTYEDMILDGRSLLRAMKIIDPKFNDDSYPRMFVRYTGDDPVGFLISRNVMRRHLNPSQRAALAAEMCMRNPAHKHRIGVRTVDAARIHGAAPSQVKAAKALARNKPEEFEKVKVGERLLGKSGDVKAVTVLLSLAEQEKFAAKCSAAGLTMSDAIRGFVHDVNSGKIEL